MLSSDKIIKILTNISLLKTIAMFLIHYQVKFASLKMQINPRAPCFLLIQYTWHKNRASHDLNSSWVSMCGGSCSSCACWVFNGTPGSTQLD